MAWRTYKISKKYIQAYTDSWRGERYWITLPKNNIYPDDYGFSVTPTFVHKTQLYMPDAYDIDICIASDKREKGARYKHFKIKMGELYEKLFNKYEVKEESDSSVENLKEPGKVYGYARISRPQQSIARQLRNIKAAYPDAVVLQEAYTGTKMDRPEWQKIYSRVKSGDTIVFDSVSRMSRNADEGVKTYFELYEKGVKLVFLKEHYIDTDVYAENMKDKIELQGTDEDEIFKGLNNYFRKLAEKQIRIAFDQAQKEVDDLHQRTHEGIETARLNGKQIGQKKGNILNVKKKEPAKEIIRKHCKDFGGSLSDQEVMELAKVSRNTYYKYKKEIKENS